MSDTKSLSERLRERASKGFALDKLDEATVDALEKAADALDAKDAEIENWQKLASQGIAIEHELRKKELQQAAEIELLKEGRTLHDEWADHLEHELAKALEDLDRATRNRGARVAT